LRRQATEIHSILGGSPEADDFDAWEQHLNRAVALRPISPWPRNNLGRVLLRRSLQFDAQAREAEAKGKTDQAEAAKVPGLKNQAKAKLDAAIEQFEKAVALAPTLLEARLNLGEVYIARNELENAEAQYRAIVRLHSESQKDPEILNNYSQAWFCLARIAIARKNTGEAIENLEKALALNSKNISAIRVLAVQRFQRGEYPEGEKCLGHLLALQPAAIRSADGSTAYPRRLEATQFSGQFQAVGKTKEAVRAWNFFAWTFATSPDPHMLDPKAAVDIAQHIVTLTNQADPLSLDTLATAQAASGKYQDAVQTAQAAIKLANSQGNKALAEAISRRLQSYQQEKTYRSDPKGDGRP
jgi:tetratricopeptide (TPR) repeat protein